MRIKALTAVLMATGTFLVPALGVMRADAGKESVIYLRPTDVSDLDPWLAQDVYSTEIAFNIFEGLVRFKRNSIAVEPCLATSWSIGDSGRRWRFTLRRGVRFHDGTPFDARAVLYSFRGRLQKEQDLHRRSNFLNPFIIAIRSSDPYTVEIALDRPYAPFLTALADSTAVIVSPSARKSGAFQPIGTGPFRFLSWSPGKSLILARHPGYWGGAASLEKVIFKVMPGSDGRVLQVKNGSADMAKIQSSKEYDELSSRDDIAILSHPAVSTHYLGFNTRKKPFDRKEVRAAFLHLIDKESMIKKIFQNIATPAYSPLPQPLFPEMRVQPVNSFSLETARAMLKTAGLQEGFSCSLYFPDGQEGSQEVVNLLAAMAKKIKITIRKVKLPFPVLMEAVNRGEHDMLLLGWSTSPDPDFFLYPLFTLSPGNRNRFFYDNPELIRLLDLGKTTLDPLQRKKIYITAQAILKEDLPWIPLFHLLNVMACNKKVDGLMFTPLGQIIFRAAAKAAR